MRREVPLSFLCGDSTLYGVLHPSSASVERGVLVVVGGPQTRIGSHRQFVLLARKLAANNVPVLRFDYRGMGDSEGESRTYEDINADIKCAVDQFFHRIPELKSVVIWGLCDAASAACFYAELDDRIDGLVLLNPWVRTDEGQAKAYLKHYYLQRLFSSELWCKVRRGEFNAGASIQSLYQKLRSLLGVARKAPFSTIKTTSECNKRDDLPLPIRMFQGLQRFSGEVLFILSGDDLTSAEFRDLAESSKPWRKMLKEPRFSKHVLPEADHTFSRRIWRDQVADWILEWVRPQ